MNEGRFVGELAAAEASQEAIMRAIMRNRDIRAGADQSAQLAEAGA